MADKQTVEAEIRDILGDEDWKYTDKPHRINQLLIKERLSEARRALRYNEGSQDAQLIRIAYLENQLGEKS